MNVFQAELPRALYVLNVAFLYALRFEEVFGVFRN